MGAVYGTDTVGNTGAEVRAEAPNLSLLEGELWVCWVTTLEVTQ